MNRTVRIVLLLLVVSVPAILFMGWSYMTGPLNESNYKEWKDYGGGPDHSKFVDFTQITKANVNKLEIAFVYATPDKEGYRFNPIVVDNIMYVLAKNNSLVALDASTGKEIWIHANLGGVIARGINFWQSKDKSQKRLIIFLNNTMQAIDAITGKSIADFGETGKGYTDMRQGLSRDPATLGRMTSTTPGHIYDDLILVGSSPGENPFDGPGHLRAYSVLTGKLAWVFHTIPQPGEFGYDTWPKDAYKYVGATNVWGEISVDEKRGIAYYPLGSPTYDYDGADRHGNNLYGNCILALDARTGKRLWHFQTVHHDLWDCDLTSAPQLITVTHKGQRVDAVAVASKNGFLYVFNRVTGEPLWPIEERPVPQSRMPDEKSSPTQPFPTAPPPFNRQTVSVTDINPYFDTATREKWITRIKAAKTGLYEPLSDEYETIAMPGSIGGANFGNTAAYPDKGLVFVQTKDLPVFYKLKKREVRSVALTGDRLTRSQTLYTQTCQTCHGADKNGLPGLGTRISNLYPRIGTEEFTQIVRNGKGRMPAMPHLDETALKDLYAFLTASARGGNAGLPVDSDSARLPEGPVVASGGIPVPPFPPKKQVGYPADYTGPKALFVEKNNWGVNAPDLLSPPWSSVVAYDLNTGTIKWKVPLGNDDDIPGGRNLGTPNGSHAKGMVVTSTGLLFSTSADGRVYAYDIDNGNVLWTGDLGRKGTAGIPAMYESGGRQFLVVCSTGPLSDKTKKEEDVPRGYVVFALPVNK